MTIDQNAAEITINRIDEDTATVVITDGVSFSAFQTRYLSFLTAGDRGQRAVAEFVCNHCSPEGRRIIAGWIASRARILLNHSPVPYRDLEMALGAGAAA